MNRTALGLCALLSAPACVGGQTGDGEPSVHDNANGEGTLGGGLCRYDTEVLDGLDAAPLGFSPEQVLAAVQGEFTTTMAWSDTAQLAITPEAGEVALTLEVRHEAGEVRVRRQALDGGNDMGGGTLGGPAPAIDIGSVGGGCAPAYEIDVLVRVATDGGALDESFDGTLIATDSQTASFSIPLDLGALTGSLAVRVIEPQGGELKQVNLSGSITPLGSYGGISGLIEVRTPGDGEGTGAVGAVSVGGSGQLATWPADNPCNDNGMGGLPIDRDTELGGLSFGELLEQAAAEFPRELTWQVPEEAPAVPEAGNGSDGEPGEGAEVEPVLGVSPRYRSLGTTQLALGISGEVACAKPSGDGGWSIEAQVLVDAETNDGAWVLSQHPGTLRAVVREGAVLEASLDADLHDIDIEDFEAASGMTGVDLTGYDGGALQVDVELTTGTGAVEAVGLDVADCVTNPPEPITDENGNVVGSAGCRGTDSIPLKRGIF